MTSIKLNLTLVGAFVLAALGTLLLTLAILAGRTGATDSYFTIYSNVSGLKFGTQVLYEGFAVGQVEKIEPFEDQGHMSFRVDLTVARGWKIPDDSIAASSAAGLLAPQTVSIHAGKSKQLLAPGSKIKPGESADLLSAMSSVAGDVDTLTSQGLMPLVDNLNTQITALGDIINHDLKPLAGNAAHIVDQANQHVPAILQNAESISANLKDVSARVEDVFSPQRLASLDGLLSGATQAATDMSGAMKDLRSLTSKGGEDLRVGIEEFRFTMETISRRSESIADNLDSASRNLQDFSRQLRQNPALLIGGREQKDTEPPMRDGKKKP